MTATLPPSVQQVFERFITTEYTTVDAIRPADHLAGDAVLQGQAPARSTSRPGSATRRRPTTPSATRRSSLLFSRPDRAPASTHPCAVLVQGTAQVDDSDLDANRERYWRESGEKLPATKEHASARVPARAVRAGTTPASTSTCARSGCSSGATATSRRSRPCTTRTSRRCARTTPRSPRRHRRRPRAARPPGTTAWTSSARRHKTAVLSRRRSRRLPLLAAAADRARPGRAGACDLGEMPDWMPAAPTRAA